MTQRTASMTLDLPQPFGPTTPAEIARERHRGGVHEGFETGEFDFFEPHCGKILKAVSTDKHDAHFPWLHALSRVHMRGIDG
jgi:hypothetical protein